MYAFDNNQYLKKMTTLNSQQKQLYVQATTQFGIEAEFIDSFSAPKRPMIEWPNRRIWDSFDSRRQIDRDILWLRFYKDSVYRQFNEIRKQLDEEQTNLLFFNKRQAA